MDSVEMESLNQHLIRDDNGHWYWNGQATQNGVGYLWLKSHPTTAYRLVWKIFNGEIPPGHTLRRTCEDPKCINHLHRELICTREQSRGARHGKSKLTDEAVIDIRDRHSKGERQVALAAEYGVSQPQISLIVQGKAWSHIQ